MNAGLTAAQWQRISPVAFDLLCRFVGIEGWVREGTGRPLLMMDWRTFLVRLRI